jgi:predicted nucleotidyltransferase
MRGEMRAAWHGVDRSDLTRESIPVETQNVRESIAGELGTLRHEFDVGRIGLFGSYAAGTPREGSDVDLLVEFRRPIGLFRFVRLRDYLSRRLGAPVDLVTVAALKPEMREHVLKTVQYVGN